MKHRIIASLLSIVMILGQGSYVSAKTDKKLPDTSNFYKIEKTQAPSDTEEEGQQEYKEDEILIEYEDEIIDTDAVEEAVETGQTDELNETEEALADLGISEQEEIASSNEATGTIAVATLPDGVSVEEAMEQLEDTPEISSVQKNYIYHLDSIAKTTISDTNKSSQYYLDSTDTYRAWSLSRSDSSSYNASGKPITVAVLDTGINYAKEYRHEDLQDVSDGGNIWYRYAYDAVTKKLMSKAGTDWNDSKGTYVDYIGHGTSVISAIAAQANNNKGIAGTSYNARVLPINVFGEPELYFASSDKTGEYYYYDAGCTSAALINGYVYLLEHADEWNIKVVNMSLGGPEGSVDKTFQKYIDQAYEKGILTVAAAGNDGSGVKMYPASYSNVISVTATDPSNLRCSFSQYNSAIDVCAPGEDIELATAGDYYFESYTNESATGWYRADTKAYMQGDGTSFAAPIVSGIAALVFAANKDLSAADVYKILKYSAVDLGAAGQDSYYGFGEVNAYHAVLAAKSKLTSAAHYTNQTSKKSSGNIVYGCGLCEDFSFKIKTIPISAVSLSATSYVYNGSVRKPGVTVKSGSTTLLKNMTSGNSDVSISYSSGCKNAGTYQVTIKGLGICTGTIKKSFKINPASISSVTLSADAYTYNGNARKPSITVKSGSKTIASKRTDSNSNVTISYPSGRKNVGTYQVTIKGKGNYTGTIKKSFKINPAATVLRSITARSKGFIVKWAKKTAQTTGYQIRYSTSSNMASAKTVTITKNGTTSKRINGLKSRRKYYVQIRTYKTVSGTKYYSSWSAKKAITTK